MRPGYWKATDEVGLVLKDTTQSGDCRTSATKHGANAVTELMLQRIIWIGSDSLHEKPTVKMCQTWSKTLISNVRNWKKKR